MIVRIATFNLENLDDKAEFEPSLAARIPVLRGQLRRLRADIICFQEVHGQERTGEPRDLHALKEVLRDTPYETFALASTVTTSGQVYDQRNLVVASRFAIDKVQQIRNDLMPAPSYQIVSIPGQEVRKHTWERPIFYLHIDLGDGRLLHLINLHLKSRRPTNIPDQYGDFMWASSSAWAEGYFLSSMKRVGQALETRLLIDNIFDQDPEAMIAVVGDFNAHPGEVPVEAITGRTENTGNPTLVYRELVSCELTIPESSRYTFIYQGKPNLLDHVLISRPLVPHYRHSEIHNEILRDETIAFATDTKYPEPDHAPFIAEFEF